MNPIDQFLFEHVEVFFCVVVWAPMAIVAWMTRNNHGDRVYTLPETKTEVMK